MKILVIGGGSMGKRRIRDLLSLGCEVVGFDTREDRCKEVEEKFGIKTIKHKEDIKIFEDADAFVISTPPSTHYEIMRWLWHKPIFMEANAYPYPPKYDFDIVDCYVSCSLRFHPLISWIKEQDLGQIYSVNWYCQQNICQWHPKQNIKDFYAGHSDTALREMCVYEMQPLSYLFGFPTKINSIVDKLSNVVEKDHALINFKTNQNIMGTLHVDLVSPELVRKIKITSSKGVWEWNLQTRGRIMEQTYFNEIKCFIESVEGKTKYPYSIKEDKNILELINNEFKK